MTILVDTGFMYALLDRDDAHHQRAVSYLKAMGDEDMVLPAPVLAELTYLLAHRLGHAKMREFVGEFENSPIGLHEITKGDFSRIKEILEQYSDAKFDFVDAFVMTLGERLGITKILTVDRRHFSIFRPSHCKFYELLP